MTRVDLSLITSLVNKICKVIKERTQNAAKIDFVDSPQAMRDMIDAGKTDANTLYVVKYTKEDLC